MRPRVVVLGVAGMLGHKVFQTLRSCLPGVIGTTKGTAPSAELAGVELLRGNDVVWDVDVTDFEALRARLQSWRPEIVVNCVGLIKQREEARSPSRSITVNALLPHRLVEMATDWGGRVVHFSTDCVFSGRRGAYREGDPSDADDLYGRSKSLGEVATGSALTLRTSIIGRELVWHRSLLDWFLSQRGNRVRGFRRVIYSGVTTNEMGTLLAWLIQDHPQLSGLYQVGSDPISKHDLLCLIRDSYRLPVEIVPSDDEVSDRSLSGELLHSATGYRPPPWRRMVADLAADPTPYEEWGIRLG